MACVDVECESGSVSNLQFIDSKLMFGGERAIDIHVVPERGDINNVSIVNSILHCESGPYAFYTDARNTKLINSVVYGAASLASGSRLNPPTIKGTRFYNRVNNRYIPGFEISGNVLHFDDVEIYYEIQPSTPLTRPILNISAFEQATGGLGNKSSCDNLYINISGVADNFQIPQIGGGNYIRGCKAHVDCTTTGKNLILYFNTGSASPLGLSTTSSRFNFGGAMEKVTGIELYYDNSVPVGFAGVLTPAVNNIQTLGVRGMEFKAVYANDGYYLRSPNGSLFLLSANNDGSTKTTAIQ